MNFYIKGEIDVMFFLGPDVHDGYPISMYRWIDVRPKRILSLRQGRSEHRVHRVATATFWRTFHHDGKISPGWWGWEVHAHPLSLYLPLCSKLWCTLQLRGQIHSHYFYSTSICTLWIGACMMDIHIHAVWDVRGKDMGFWHQKKFDTSGILTLQ